jgi:hypothetical protein
MAQFVAAYPSQKPGGAYFGKVQKDGIKALIPDGGPGLGTAEIGDHIYAIFPAVFIKIT